MRKSYGSGNSAASEGAGVPGVAGAPGKRTRTQRLKGVGGQAAAPRPATLTTARREPGGSATSFVDELLAASAPRQGSLMYVGASQGTELAAEHMSRAMGMGPVLDQTFKEHPEEDVEDVLEKVALDDDNGHYSWQHPSLANEPGTGPAPFGGGRRSAVYVANAAYPKSPLSQTIVDAGLVQGHLRNRGFASVGGDLHRDNAAAAMEQAFRSGGDLDHAPGDELFLFYSGHGLPVGLAGIDCPDVANGTGVLEGVMPNATLIEIAEGARAKGADVYVVVDACYSGALVDQARTRHIDRLAAPVPGGAAESLVELARDVERCREIFAGAWDGARERQLAKRLATLAQRFETHAGRALATPPAPRWYTNSAPAAPSTADEQPARSSIEEWDQALERMVNEVLVTIHERR